MGAFTPFKRNANSFKYTPRYYDPAKEEREQRREELFGRRLEGESDEYTPGEYIRTQREARNARRGVNKGIMGGSFRVWIMLGIVVVLFFLGSSLYNSVANMLTGTEATKTQVESSSTDEDTFNPEATIIIVPNDYVEE